MGMIRNTCARPRAFEEMFDAIEVSRGRRLLGSRKILFTPCGQTQCDAKTQTTVAVIIAVKKYYFLFNVYTRDWHIAIELETGFLGKAFACQAPYFDVSKFQCNEVNCRFY